MDPFAALEAFRPEPSPALVGRSRALQEIRGTIGTAAPTSVPVLITGETGTGKEVAARVLHAASPRAAGPFVAVNCAALPETLLESELFGHERGAFTGAWTRRPGCFEMAHEGTILLDELAAMPASLQPKLLRVLEMLYYRLNVFAVSMPPLRERREDIPLLVETFIAESGLKYGKRVRGADREALGILVAQAWPGNVRQLRNNVEWAVLACEGDVVTPACLPPVVPVMADIAHPAPPAAATLQISTKTLHDKLRRYAAVEAIER